MKCVPVRFLRAALFATLGMSVVAAPLKTSMATLLSVVQLTELMIEEEGGDVSALGLLFGPGGSIGFSSTVDTAGMSFSFSSTPGASYLGQPLSLNGTGIYNPVINILGVSSTGTLGPTAFSTSGSASLTFSGGTAIGTEAADFLLGGIKSPRSSPGL
jgi:hypothetical protein